MRKEESERCHSQWPGAAVGTRLIDCTLQIGERLLNLRPQQRSYRSQLNLAAVAADEAQGALRCPFSGA